MLNGFRVKNEAPPLEARPDLIAPLTLPAEVFTFIPPREAVLSEFKNGDKERKIYTNTELEEDEVKLLKSLQEEASKRNVEFMPSISAMAGRFLSRARGDPSKALKLMQATQEWREDYFKDGPVSDDSVLEDLKYGIVYWCGRDSYLRPTLIVRASRIPQEWYKEKRIDKLIRILVFCMEYFLRYMVIPGRVENNCLIVDLNGLSISQVPLSALSEVYKVMSNHYIGRVFKFCIVNLSSALSTVAYFAKQILTDRQKQKLNILDSVSELSKDWALHQLEDDLGGSRLEIQQFYPFPLQAGPFETGSSKSSDQSAVPNLHKVLSASAARGRVWDWTSSHEENRRVEFTQNDVEVLRRHGIDVKPDLVGAEILQAADAALIAQKEADANALAAETTTANTDVASKTPASVEVGTEVVKPSLRTLRSCTETSGVDIVNVKDFNRHKSCLAKSLARSHGDVEEQVLRFLEEAKHDTSGRLVKSNFQPFEFRRDQVVQRLTLEVSVARRGEATMRVAHKSKYSSRSEVDDILEAHQRCTLCGDSGIDFLGKPCTCHLGQKVSALPQTSFTLQVDSAQSGFADEDKDQRADKKLKEINMEGQDKAVNSGWWNCRACCTSNSAAGRRDGNGVTPHSLA